MPDNVISSSVHDDFLTRRELAELLRVRQVKTIDRYIREGWLPRPLELGQKRLFSRREVVAALQRNRGAFGG